MEKDGRQHMVAIIFCLFAAGTFAIRLLIPFVPSRLGYIITYMLARYRPRSAASITVVSWNVNDSFLDALTLR